MKKTSVAIFALALAGLSTSASAASFMALQAGRTDGDIDVSDVGSIGDKGNNWSVRGGYYFHPNWAVEGFYTHVYDDRWDDVSLKATALGLGVVGKKNFGADGNGFFLSGRAGVAQGKLEGEIEGYGHDSADSIDPYFGASVGYDFSPTFGMSLNFDRLTGGDDGVDITANVFTLGLEFRTE